MHTSKLAQCLALLALSFAITSCGGQSQRQTASSPASSVGRCYESPRSYPESGDAEPASAPSSDSGSSYDDDDSNCDSSAPMQDQDDSAEGEITRLWNEIREQRLASGLSAEPLVSKSVQVQSTTVEEIQGDEDHAEPRSQVCISTCRIEASICKNAKSICRLADNISDNQWAAEKCTSGKASCKEATQKCSNCVSGESATLPE